jgi:4-hydroxybenzoate polyprenyltransferase
MLLLLQSLRPRQWVKNLIILAALLFAERLFDSEALLQVLAAVLLFCGVSGAVYLLNDILDREADSHHPLKQYRPIASGALSVRNAAMAYGVLMAISLTGSFWLYPQFGWIVVIYAVMQMGYSLWLKHLVIIDLFIIAFGFVLRAIAGAVVIQVAISNWLLICTILLSLFLALCKRRSEIVRLDTEARHHRKILSQYGMSFLDQMISIVGSATVVSYSLYTMSDETIAKFGTADLKYTIPLVLYGIFRYLYLVHQEKKGDAPERVLFSDPPLLGAVVLFAVMAALIVY